MTARIRTKVPGDSGANEAGADPVSDVLRARRRGAAPWFLVVLVALVAAATGWAGSEVLHPRAVAARPDAYTLVKVAQGHVEQSLTLNVAGNWTTRPSGTNGLAGVVTSVALRAGAVVTSGDVLYTVDEDPVVIAQGHVPAYRDLGPGESGTDVRQLQAMLSDLGLLNRKPTGRFDAATERAVSTWHKMLGAGNSARVAFGEIIFVPTHLPARLSLDASVVHRDARLGGGEPVLSTLPDEPRFTMTVTALQSGMIPDGTGVVITSPRGHTWAATVSGRGPQDGGDGVVLTLTGRDGAPIAGDQADELPVAGDTLLAARVQIVPATDGLVVPAAALATRGDGTTVVTLADGRVQPVAVTATAQGMAVITGVPERTKVRISGGQGS